MIIGFSRLIVETPQVYGKRAIPPALLADLTVILRNSQHLAGLVDDVLDLSQIEANRMALTKERTDIPELVATALTVVRPLFESKHFYLQAEIADDLPPLLVDRTRIREVLLNLLSNAGRFTEVGGVKVRVARAGSEVIFSVADTGPGIASADLSKLFQPFQQLDNALSRRHEGTGLGLTLSKRFVELHGGRCARRARLPAYLRCGGCADPRVVRLVGRVRGDRAGDRAVGQLPTGLQAMALTLPARKGPGCVDANTSRRARR